MNFDLEVSNCYCMVFIKFIHRLLPKKIAKQLHGSKSPSSFLLVIWFSTMIGRWISIVALAICLVAASNCNQIFFYVFSFNFGKKTYQRTFGISAHHWQLVWPLHEKYGDDATRSKPTPNSDSSLWNCVELLTCCQNLIFQRQNSDNT